MLIQLPGSKQISSCDTVRALLLQRPSNPFLTAKAKSSNQELKPATVTDTITIKQPDDWHIHLRDSGALPRTVNDAARQFNRVLVMPNLKPPVTDVRSALAYRERIMSALESGHSIDPQMALYLTDSTTPAMVAEAAANEHCVAFKWYPAGATTNSDSGVTDVSKIYPALDAMQKYGVILCIHGEVTDSDIDIFDREAVFIEKTLTNIVRDFPNLKIIFEHITTKNAVDFVLQSSENIAATITAHHLLYNRNTMLVGGIRPHYYCLPILKRLEHQQALIKAATSGNPKFFLGTDSAPHLQTDKESDCGCAGSYTAYSAIEFYADVFEKENALEKLEGFSSVYGAKFYGVPINDSTVTLERKEWTLPNELEMNGAALIPLDAGQALNWRLIHQ